MNAASAKRYFNRTGFIFVVDKVRGINTVTVRIKQYEAIEPAIRYVQRSDNAYFVNYTVAKRMGYDMEVGA